MAWQQTQQCPDCKKTHRVCIDQEDVPGSDDRFRYICPDCGEEIEFSPGASTQVDECPEDGPVATKVNG